jgi:hypothetical protein
MTSSRRRFGATPLPHHVTVAPPPQARRAKSFDAEFAAEIYARRAAAAEALRDGDDLPIDNDAQDGVRAVPQ